jgi:hypothetical protein
MDHERGPAPPAVFRRREPEKPDLKRPLPPEWSNATKPLRDLAEQIEKLVGDR